MRRITDDGPVAIQLDRQDNLGSGEEVKEETEKDSSRENESFGKSKIISILLDTVRASERTAEEVQRPRESVCRVAMSTNEAAMRKETLGF